MKKLKYLIIHCTATPKGREVSKEDILRWHTSPKHKGGRGWRQVGYTDLFPVGGGIINLVPLNQNEFVEGWEITNGVRGINDVAKHIVYAGGLDKHRNPKDTRTTAQKKDLETYIKYMILRHPDIEIAGHNEFSEYKACPSFDVPTWLESIGVASKNIYNQNN